MKFFKQKLFLPTVIIFLVTGFSIARAQTSAGDSLSQFDQSSGSSGQNCWASEAEMIAAPPSMANFDKPLCSQSNGNTSSAGSNSAPASDLSQFDNPSSALSASTPTDPFAQFDNPSSSESSASPFDQFDKSSAIMSAALANSPDDSSSKDAGLPDGDSRDLATLVKNLKPGQVIVHDAENDSAAGPAFFVLDSSSIYKEETSWSNNGDFFYNTSSNGVPNGQQIGVVQSVVLGVENWLNGIVSANVMNNMISTVQTTGSTYQWFQSLQNQVSSLPGGANDANIANIYNLLQQNLTVNNSTAANYTQAESLASATGVCRNQATDLAVLLSDKGYEASVVTDGTHAWTRVNYNNSTFDLDPNAYYSYIQLPARSLSSPNQVIPVTPPKTNP